MEVSMKPYGCRDRLAGALCNWILRHVASERYRKMIGGSIRYGLAAAAIDEEEGRPPAFFDDHDLAAIGMCEDRGEAGE
jgi:hypothetical protein